MDVEKDVTPSRIILIGFMGSGKTTLAKQIARKLGYQFLDTDALIEEKSEMSIAELFTTKGEAFFRTLEAELIEELFETEKVVIATGGGMPCFHNNIDRLNELGLTIYLHRPILELAYRLLNAKKKRPLVAQLNEAELITYIEETLQQREIFYNQAKIKLDRTQQNNLYLTYLLKDYL